MTKIQVLNRLLDWRAILPQSDEPIALEVSSGDSGGYSKGSTSVFIPLPLQVAAGWAWRMILIALAGFGLVLLLIQIKIVVIPVLLALLFTALLEPVLVLLHRRLRLPRTLAAVLSLLFGLVAVIGLLTLATRRIILQFGDLARSGRAGFLKIQEAIENSEWQHNFQTIQRFWNDLPDWATNWLTKTSSGLVDGGGSGKVITSSLTGFAASAPEVFAVILASLFCLFFFLKDGRKIWQWVLRLVPQPARNPLNEAVIRGWVSIGSYARTQMIVAAIDAIFIGLGAFLIGVKLAVPIGVLVFLGAFIPIVGAVVTGGLASLVALVDPGHFADRPYMAAIVMLIIIIAVQQIESHLLQPLLMSSAVDIHPMAVLLGVAGGAYVAGILGAIFAVPVIAFINTVVLYLNGHDKFLRLKYDPDRAGGAPGTLDAEMEASLEPTKKNLDSARRTKQKAIAEGRYRTLAQSRETAEEIRKDNADKLAEFDEETPTVTDSDAPAGETVASADAKTAESGEIAPLDEE
ncbi:MAG: AI-2E family transporter [Varibaculum sp.]|nr:AI-2E family transporter [Varibaculum sp.]